MRDRVERIDVLSGEWAWDMTEYNGSVLPIETGRKCRNTN